MPTRGFEVCDHGWSWVLASTLGTPVTATIENRPDHLHLTPPTQQPIHPRRGVPLELPHDVLIPGEDPSVGVPHRSHCDGVGDSARQHQRRRAVSQAVERDPLEPVRRRPVLPPRREAGWLEWLAHRVADDKFGAGESHGEQSLGLSEPVPLERLGDEAGEGEVPTARLALWWSDVERALGSGQRMAHVYIVVDIRPPEPEHLFASQAEPEREVHGTVNRRPAHSSSERRPDVEPAIGVHRLSDVADEVGHDADRGSPTVRPRRPPLTASAVAPSTAPEPEPRLRACNVEGANGASAPSSSRTSSGRRRSRLRWAMPAGGSSSLDIID